MEESQKFLALIVLLPLLGALLNAFLFRFVSVWINCALATLAIFIPFLLSLKLFCDLSTTNVTTVVTFFDWISISLFENSFFTIPFQISLDHLSALFLLIITGIGTLIHLYSGEYMVHEKKPYRFFVYLNLFIVSMLFLVLGSNMLVTFLGWEGVGVCSYLLIGYWYEESANAMAGIKAFIANRVGDLGFLLAMFFCYTTFGTLNYAELATIVAHAPADFFTNNSCVITAIGLLLLLAVSGKSAQIPLYTWLPDAMAGPTPVSALIHAATMVTSGIYLMNRVSFLLVLSDTVMMTIAIIGALTALLAATIGLVQNDIKKVLAYSTVSQLGYMVLACGVGAFQYGVAHVMTHAFFKALLFLAAGSVIHAMHHEQDIRKMGGLIRKMPLTGVTFVVGTLAIIGLPPFSGFFSKDAILAAAWGGPFGHPIFWAIGCFTAGLTAFYMLRLTILVFFGQTRAEHPDHIHETNAVIGLPLVILAILAALGGAIAIPEIFTGHKDFISTWLSPVLSLAQDHLAQRGAGHLSHELELGLMGVSVGVVLISATLAILIYRKGLLRAQGLATTCAKTHRFLLGKWFVDELYNALFTKPLWALSRFLARFADKGIVDNLVNGVPGLLYISTSVASDGQSGIVRGYLKFTFVALFVLLLCLFF